MRMKQMAMTVLTGNMLTNVINIVQVLWGETPKAMCATLNAILLDLDSE